MSKIAIELFDKDAEAVGFEHTEGRLLEIRFNEKLEGLVSIDGIVSRVSEGICLFDTRLIDEGEYSPFLLTEKMSVRLPTIKKTARRVLLSECSDEYVRSASLRERRLAARVSELEKRLEQIMSRLDGTTIF